MGVGLLVLRDPADGLVPLVEGGTGTQSRSLAQPEDSPERYESGTLNVPGIAGLEAGLLFVRRQGPQALCQKELALLARLHRQLDRLPGVELYTEEPRAPYFLPVLSFNLRGMESEAVGDDYFADAAFIGDLHCAPLAHQKLGTQQGTVRVSPSAFTRREEIDALARQVGRLCREKV